MFVIFDLDGTLADIEHRRHFVEGKKKDWDAFFEACDQDLPICPVVQTLTTMKTAGYKVEIWSGRMDTVRTKTIRWLSQQGVHDVPIRMRPAGDYTPDDELKRSWLQISMRDGHRPDLVFDDRNKVVAMWRRHNIVCAQVAPGDF